MVVQALVAEHGMSQRSACQASGIARSTLRYRPVARDDSGVITFIQAYMALNPRHGFGLLYDSARHQGKPWGKTVLWRVYCELRLNLPRRGKKRLPARIKQPLQAAGQPNQGWGCDFMADALWSGRRFRTFNVIDEFNREDPGATSSRVACAPAKQSCMVCNTVPKAISRRYLLSLS